MILRYKKLTPTAKPPQYAHSNDACFDVYADKEIILDPYNTYIVPTGLAFDIPAGKMLKVYIRSGIAANTRLRMANSVGIIDEGYRGELKLIIDNMTRITSGYSNHLTLLDGTQEFTPDKVLYGTYKIRVGDRLAQVEICDSVQATLVETLELGETERGIGGLGHTGTQFLSRPK